MDLPVLVGYATSYGSTKEVAEAVAAALREGGVRVDVRLARDVRALAP
jgi:menaquinone-dependent protoporphyrinogen IX oxidase